ncbi:hypothetical protein IU414_06455 [Nocardia farcinica]|uniref:hypothetical protein n=1 Tax=Nocardia farcinica TaxID=37329 RepID=UPI001892D806|nr:hypothetical protein [Nocardia farcinica]MBF6254434.1 hypothetical protein [Nocardia farcinica]MBF6584400.1 hypothetical protein [Nocardia farcinica]
MTAAPIATWAALIVIAAVIGHVADSRFWRLMAGTQAFTLVLTLAVVGLILVVGL